jgi:hypothetical protein
MLFREGFDQFPNHSWATTSGRPVQALSIGNPAPSVQVNGARIEYVGSPLPASSPLTISVDLELPLSGTYTTSFIVFDWQAQPQKTFATATIEVTYSMSVVHYTIGGVTTTVPFTVDQRFHTLTLAIDAARVAHWSLDGATKMDAASSAWSFTPEKLRASVQSDDPANGESVLVDNFLAQQP